MESRLLATASTLACLLGIVYVAHLLRALRSSQTQLQFDHRDALVALSRRADKAEGLASQLTDGLRAIERGDRKTIEAALKAAQENAAYLQERLTESQRAVVGLADAKVSANILGATSRKDVKEDAVPAGPTRWQAASGTYRPSLPLSEMLKPTKSATLASPYKIVPDPVEGM